MKIQEIKPRLVDGNLVDRLVKTNEKLKANLWISQRENSRLRLQIAALEKEANLISGLDSQGEVVMMLTPRG